MEIVLLIIKKQWSLNHTADVAKKWQRISRSDIPLDYKINNQRVLKGIWVFRFKRSPGGKPYKFKDRYCVRGDLQTKGLD